MLKVLERLQTGSTIRAAPHITLEETRADSFHPALSQHTPSSISALRSTCPCSGDPLLPRAPSTKMPLSLQSLNQMGPRLGRLPRHFQSPFLVCTPKASCTRGSPEHGYSYMSARLVPAADVSIAVSRAKSCFLKRQQPHLLHHSISGSGSISAGSGRYLTEAWEKKGRAEGQGFKSHP